MLRQVVICDRVVALAALCAVSLVLTARADLTMNRLGKHYARNASSTTIYAEEAYMGEGVMSVRNNLEPSWKDDGYYQRNRDCGQTFTATRDCILDAVVIRTSNSARAVFRNAIGRPMFMQLYEIHGTPTINDNGTPYGSEPEHGFGVGQGMHRCDDYFEGITFTSLGVAHGAVFPNIPPTYPTGEDGKLHYIHCDFTGEHEIGLQSGHRYAFVLGFTQPFDAGALYEDQCRIGISMENYAAAIEPPDLYHDLTPYAGGFSIRREGDGTLPPTMIPGTTPHPELLDEALFPTGSARYSVVPTSDGYPDVDTYRDWNFYLEVKDNTDDVQILDGWRAGATHSAVPGTARALVVAVCVESATAPSLSSVTYGEQAMTLVASETIVDGSHVAFTAAYVLNDVGIAAASDSTISLAWSTAPSKNPTILSCIYEHVDQSAPAGAHMSASGTASPVETGSLSNGAGDMLIAAITNGSNQSGFAFGGDFSELIEESGDGANGGVAHKIAQGTACNAQVTVTNGNRSALVAFVLQKAGAVGTRRQPGLGTRTTQPRLAYLRSRDGILVVERAPSGAVSVTVHDLSGQRIAAIRTTGTDGKLRLSLPATRASHRVYVVRIEAAAESAACRPGVALD
ncbi:MAG: hypothetical protein GF331_16440 [Chitinivibrionales bacterium]|nr:hypothetical protein [Chitinivibrionales bacterium]